MEEYVAMIRRHAHTPEDEVLTTIIEADNMSEACYFVKLLYNPFSSARVYTASDYQFHHSDRAVFLEGDEKQMIDEKAKIAGQVGQFPQWISVDVELPDESGYTFILRQEDATTGSVGKAYFLKAAEEWVDDNDTYIPNVIYWHPCNPEVSYE